MKGQIKKLVFLAVVGTFLASVFLSIPTADAVKPSDFDLKEGDLISAIFSDDPDVYIINEHGFKRLFLNPEIFNFYGHLGGFVNVKLVTPEVRDAFPTSGLFRNCGDNDDKVYSIDVEDEDAGRLHWIDKSGEEIVEEDADFFKKVFCINKKEFDWYPKGESFKSINELPQYSRAGTAAIPAIPAIQAIPAISASPSQPLVPPDTTASPSFSPTPIPQAIPATLAQPATPAQPSQPQVTLTPTPSSTASPSFTPTPTVSVSVCSDTDGGVDYYNRGTLSFGESFTVVGYTDACILRTNNTGGYANVSSCVASSECQLIEKKCPEGGSDATFEFYTCENGCQDGACLTPTPDPTPDPGIPAGATTAPDGTWCYDSDGNGAYQTKGSCQDNTGTYTDYCDSNVARDYYCSGSYGSSGLVTIKCDNGGYTCTMSLGDTCVDGTCVFTSANNIDSDIQNEGSFVARLFNSILKLFFK